VNVNNLDPRGARPTARAPHQPNTARNLMTDFIISLLVLAILAATLGICIASYTGGLTR